MKQHRFSLNAVQNLALSFTCIILLGGFLLMLPISSRSGESLPFLDAVFTSASATCVTALCSTTPGHSSHFSDRL